MAGTDDGKDMPGPDFLDFLLQAGRHIAVTFVDQRQVQFLCLFGKLGES